MSNPILGEVLLHPQRLKIVASLMRLGPSTAHEIAASVKSMPQATLYRQLRYLADCNVVTVVGERRVRGTVERMYSANEERLNVDASELNGLPSDEVQALFGTFLGWVAGEFESYAERAQRDFKADGVRFAADALDLRGERLGRFIGDVNALIERYKAAGPEAAARAHTFAHVLIPAAVEGRDETTVNLLD